MPHIGIRLYVVVRGLRGLPCCFVTHADKRIVVNEKRVLEGGLLNKTTFQWLAIEERVRELLRDLLCAICKLYTTTEPFLVGEEEGMKWAAVFSAFGFFRLNGATKQTWP